MKIIKNNKKFENVFPMRITCRRVVDECGYSYGKETDFCGSELEIEAEDIKKHPWEKYPDDSGTDFGVVCPVCNQFVVVDREKLPKLVLNNAESIRLGR